MATPPKSIWLDATIAVAIASLTSLALSMSSKESYEYVEPNIRYWLLVGVGFLTQGLHALSKFRDGTFTRHTDAAERKQDLESGISKTTVTEKTEKEVAITPAPGADSRP